MGIKLGLHMCGWGDRPLPDVLLAARELGYDGVELAPAWLEQTCGGLEEIDRLLDREGVPLAPTVDVGGPKLDDAGLAESVEKTTRYARWARRHGGDSVTYSTVQGRDGLRSNDERERLLRAWNAVAEAAAAEGCTPLYHNHYVVSHEVSRALLEEDTGLLDWSTWKLCVDTGHLVLALNDPLAFVRKWADKIVWAHCKDVKTRNFDPPDLPRRMGEFAAESFTALGTGVVDFTGVVRALEGAGYDSWLVVEQDASPNPYETARASFQHLRGIRDGDAG